MSGDTNKNNDFSVWFYLSLLAIIASLLLALFKLKKLANFEIF